MIIFDYCMRGLVSHIVQSVEKRLKKQTVDQMTDQIMELPEGTKIQLLAPVVRGRKGTHAKLFEKAKKEWICSCARGWEVCMN